MPVRKYYTPSQEKRATLTDSGWLCHKKSWPKAPRAGRWKSGFSGLFDRPPRSAVGGYLREARRHRGQLVGVDQHAAISDAAVDLPQAFAATGSLQTVAGRRLEQCAMRAASEELPGGVEEAPARLFPALFFRGLPQQRNAQMRTTIEVYIYAAAVAHRDEARLRQRETTRVACRKIAQLTQWNQHAVASQPRAWAMSASKSSVSSMPIDRRTIESATPIDARRSAPISQ